MLQTLPSTRQNEGEPRRQWYFSNRFDLYVWFDHQDLPIAFQLAYRKPTGEHSLCWHHQRGFQHFTVDDERGRSGRALSALLVPDGPVDGSALLSAFCAEAEDLPEAVRALVTSRIGQFSSHPGAAQP